MELSIACQTRDAKAKPNALRREGLLPAVLYGHNGTESVSLTVNQRDADALLRKATTNSVVKLDIPDMPWSGTARLQEIQAHPWRDMVYHLSFFAVKDGDSSDS